MVINLLTSASGLFAIAHWDVVTAAPLYYSEVDMAGVEVKGKVRCSGFQARHQVRDPRAIEIRPLNLAFKLFHPVHLAALHIRYSVLVSQRTLQTSVNLE